MNPVALDDAGNAAVLVTRTEEVFNGTVRVMGAGDQHDSFEGRLGHEQNLGAWLTSDNSFKDGVDGRLQTGFTITDQGGGGDPAFVVTPNFQATAGSAFSFNVDTDFKAGDTFQADVYQNTDTGWQPLGSIAGVDGVYTYSFPADGEYRITFTVDDSSNGAGKASATIDITTDNYFVSGGEETITLTDATGSILVNDTLGDGTNVFAFDDGTVNPDGSTTVVGDHGTLTVESDGTYTYTPNADSTGGVDAFSYTLADADTPPDTDPATLTINVDYQVTTLPDGSSPESLSVGEASTVLDSADLLEAPPPPLVDDGGAIQAAGIEGAGGMDVLAANFNAESDESVKRMLKGGDSKNT